MRAPASPACSRTSEPTPSTSPWRMADTMATASGSSCWISTAFILPSALPATVALNPARSGLAILAVQAADHQLDAEVELLVHVAAAAEQHGEPEQVVGRVTGHHLGHPAHLGQLVLRPGT